MKSFSDMVFYSLAEAKKEFSNVINLSREKEIIITKNGKPASVIVDYDKYFKLMDFVSRMYDLYMVDLGAKGDFDKIKDISIDYILSLDDKDNQEV